MTPDEYLKERVDDQIGWYSSKSQWNQRCFKILRVIELAFASMIPFLVNDIATDTSPLKLIVGSMGVCIAVISGLVSLYKFQENWIEYRTTAETLKHEKYLFLTKSPPYGNEGHFHTFVERIESLISKENSVWARNINDKAKEQQHG
jgi:hypothetical protein